MRLGKYLAQAGVASRRGAEQLVFDGRVSVGGTVVRDPARDVDDTSGVAVDGTPLVKSTGPRRVYVVNKPEGVISTARDPQGRPTVVDLVESEERLYPVGRLDINTTGLILLTNDGDLANHLTHPRYEVPKTYHVTVTRGPLKTNRLEQLARGVTLDDGPTLPAKVRKLAPTQFEIVLREGRNRQVRRMTEAVGYRVKSLERVGFGSVELGSLAIGGHRRLKHAEIEALYKTGPKGARSS
jgi:23S rRNA pseudouridine2605 synthase